MRERHSVAQDFFMNLLERTGCLSVKEIETIMSDIFGASPNQTKLLIHTAHAESFCHYDDDFRYVVLGRTSDNKLNKLRVNTIEAFAVAYKIAGTIEDLNTVYKPFSAGDLRFRSGDMNYEIFVTDESGISSLMYIEEKYRNQLEKAKKMKNLSLDDWKEAYTTSIILFPNGSNLKKCAGMIQDLDLTFPMLIASTRCDDVFGDIDVQVYEPN